MEAEVSTGGFSPYSKIPIFICFVDGAWKHDEQTGSVGWVLELHDGTMDLLSLQGYRQSLSPLHTEMHGLIWAMKSLIRKCHYCSLSITDTKELTHMVASPDEWHDFLPELSELAVLRESFLEFTLIYRQRDQNKKADLLVKSARTRNFIFSFIATSVLYWFHDTDNVFV